MVIVIMKKAASVAAPATLQEKTVPNHDTTPCGNCQQRLHAKLREDAMYQLGYNIATSQITAGRLNNVSLCTLQEMMKGFLFRETPYFAGAASAVWELIKARRLS